ncbi:MAG: GNA1162 family protein [Leptothrix ochracea]|jgi:hypothetical protein|uniref:GNA1162 family protein n=1 Tax=Leptothrix ochracea TaxID=735331 RepID=UPI0034E26C76
MTMLRTSWACLGVLTALALGGCATPPPPAEPALITKAVPRSILVVPVVNQSLDVDAPNYLLATLAAPLAEKGYYVFPVHTTKLVLEQEGFYEGEQIHKQPPQALAKLFGADAILYVTIKRWEARYVVLQTTVSVEFDYRIVSKDGQELWKAHQVQQYQPQNNNNGLLGAVIAAAMARAAPNYMPLARQAHEQVFWQGATALPRGPYRPAEPN